MNTDRLHSALRIALFSIIVISIAILGWWYFVLSAKEADVERVSGARGLSVDIPEFSGAEGSTYLNIAESEPSVPLWRAVREAAGRFSGITDIFGTTERDIEQSSLQAELRQIGRLPTAGAGFFESNDLLKVRFVERATGNMLEADMESTTVARVTNTLMPQVIEALFSGSRVFLRMSENGVLVTKTGVAESTSVAKSLLTSNFEEGIVSLAVSPRGNVAYVVQTPDGGSDIVVAEGNGDKKKVLAHMSSSDWLARFFKGDRVVVTQKASDDIAGYSYEIDGKGVFTPIVRSAPGLMVEPHASSSALLYSTSANGALTLYFKSSPSDEPRMLPIATLAEKCVFAPSGTVAYCAAPEGTLGAKFVDRWYRGETHTRDLWYEVDLTAGSARILLSEYDVDALLDVEMPVISADGSRIVFRNAYDWSLWLLSLGEAPKKDVE